MLCVFARDDGFTAGAAERAADLPVYLAWAVAALAVAVVATRTVSAAPGRRA